MKKKSVKKTLLSTIVSLILCVSMFIGTTFAWFTDSVTSSNNKIIAGNLSVDLEMLVEENGELQWESIKTSNKPIFNYTNWEPGYCDVKVLKVENEGSLALNWKALFVPQGEMGILADVIDVYFTKSVNELSYPADRQLTDYAKAGTLREFVNNASTYLNGSLEALRSEYFSLALKMRGEEAGNIYQNQALPTFDIQILASQATVENDSFGNDYDSSAVFPNTRINFEAKKTVTDVIDTDTGALTEVVEIGEETSFYKAVAPAGVTLADGAESLDLSVKTVENSEANVTLSDNEVALSVDVHVEGVAENNTTPMQIVLKNVVIGGLNNGNIKLYHVEDGETVEMTSVATFAELDAHNEFFYDTITGDITLSLASFSEVQLVATEVNHWDGTSATAFAGGTGTENDPYLIANASQLAYFRDLVDGGKTFEGEYVKLGQDVILNHLHETSNQFNPIGYGYDYDGFMKDGKTFNGTFDGDGHGIHGLWQNGWDLEANYPGEDYTYSMAGGGLFASVVNATIKNLTIKHANITMECVDMGILVGYSQGRCNYENIYIYASSIANYQRATGGVVGEVSPQRDSNGKQVGDSLHTFTNVNVGSSCTVGSLWGDFDAPCGGVIGAKWDKYAEDNTQVVMTDVKVSCVLDVYNDVTSAYQWYAYRRAGMLIGNTEETVTENGRTTADAPFLTCTNCVVIYDDWRNYTYCEFTNDNNPGKNYPWVRVEPGLNCSSYSNPRYGHPVDAAGNQAIDDLHVHQAGDECMTLLPFDQLYGGGQGVYGTNTHKGVSEGKYTVTFIGLDGDVVGVHYVTDNTQDVSLNGKLPDLGSNIIRWEDAQGTAYATYNNGSWTYNKSINAGNIADIVLYPEVAGEFNIYFVDHNGKTLHYEIFKEGQSHTLDKNTIEAERLAIQKELDNTEKVIKVVWDKDINNIDFARAKDDITVKIKLELSNSSITLEPVYDEETNLLIRYRVVDVNQDDTNTSIHIPSHVGHAPVDEIVEGAFDGFDNLTAVRIPSTMKSLGDGMFPGGLFNKQTVTIYFDGTAEDWETLLNASSSGWDDGLGDGSRVFFLKDGKVDIEQGYYEYFKKNVFSSPTWYHHNHAYVENPTTDGCPAKGHYKSFTDYDAEGRPDRNYWIND